MSHGDQNQAKFVEVTTIDRSYKDTKKELRIAVGEYDGYYFVTLREFFQADDGSMRPGKQGCTIKSREFPAIYEALEQAEAKLRVLETKNPRQRQATPPRRDEVPF